VAELEGKLEDVRGQMADLIRERKVLSEEIKNTEDLLSQSEEIKLELSGQIEQRLGEIRNLKNELKLKEVFLSSIFRFLRFLRFLRLFG
jgi:septal ring factor EnvC (AmiA/AmiB activator)